MPQPNMQQMLKQVQKMQQDMLAAQEALKDEVVEASAGGGMVTVKVTGDLVVKSITIDPEAVDPEDVELLQDMVLAAVNEALRSAQELAVGEARRDHRRPRRPGRPRRPRAPGPVARGRALSVYAPPVQRLITELSKLPGRRRPHRPAAGVPPAARERRGGVRAGRRDPRGQGADRPVRDVLQPRRRAALPDLRRRAPRPRADLRGRGALGRDLDRAHARVPRAATTCSAARSRRSTGSIPRT